MVEHEKDVSSSKFNFECLEANHELVKGDFPTLFDIEKAESRADLQESFLDFDPNELYRFL